MKKLESVSNFASHDRRMSSMLLKPFILLLLIGVFCFSGCKRKSDADAQTIRAQNGQIAQLIEISKKQSEQISQLASALETAKATGAASVQPSNIQAAQPTIAGAVFINRPGGGSTILRDLQVLLLSNAQIRWNSYVKEGVTYSEHGENRLRSDLAQFTGNINDLIASYTTTDADGKYQFHNIPPGNYYLFAQYTGVESTICWFIPVAVPSTGALLEVNLANSTAYATAYREVR